jgi:1,4-alpha-glucan branching enzyme
VAPAGREFVAAVPSSDARPLRLARLVLVPDDPNIRQVAVAGDFNGWNPEETFMERRGSAWVAWLELPADVYEYVFVVDGERWLVDPLAVRTRADGFGGENAVLDLSL